jgi:hypothetical protein
MRFRWQNYNEFKSGVRWHDYVSCIIHEFPLLLVRRYDWMEKESSTLIVELLGFQLYLRVWQWQTNPK